MNSNLDVTEKLIMNTVELTFYGSVCREHWGKHHDIQSC